MADDYSKQNIGFSVDVTTGKADENIDKVIESIDKLENKINDLKKQRKETDDIDLDVLNKSIKEAQRELIKLNSVYGNWIQKATNVDTKPIGNVKKQIQELQDILSKWDGKATSFKEQVADRFLIPNSAIEQAKQYREIIRQIDGLNRNGAFKDNTKSFDAIRQFTLELKKAETNAKALKDQVNGIGDATKKMSSFTPTQRFSQWDGKGDFMNTLPISGNYTEQIRQLKKAASDLSSTFGTSTNTETQQKLKTAIDSIRKSLQDAEKANSSLKQSLRDGSPAATQEALNQKIKEQAKAERDAQKAAKDKATEAIRQYSELQMKIAEIQAKIKMNYIDNYKSDPSSYAANFSALRKEYKGIAIDAKNAEREMKRVSELSDMTGTMRERIRQRASWVLSNVAVATPLYAGASYIDNMKQMESEMAQFSQVMSTNSHAVNAFGKSLHDLSFDDVVNGIDTTAAQSIAFRTDLEHMKNSLVDLAVKYGEASGDVIRSATLWGRKYKDNATILTMTDAAMKLAVADSFSVTEANKNLESSIVQWGFQINNNNDAMLVSSKIIDSWTALAHKMAVSAQDLSAANQRAAQSMNAVGLSFDEGQAIIASALGNTQQKGGEIGNAIKSIMGSIHSDKAIADIQSLGIEMYKTGETGKKEFRDVGTVLMELMLKTQDTKQNLEDLLKDISGGKWQWNKAGALMNFQTYIQALKLSTESYGFTQEQVGMQMDTLARKAEGLKQALINLTTSSSGGAVSTILKDIIELTTKLLSTLNSYSPEQLGMIIVMNVVVFKGAAFVRTMKNMASAIESFGNSVNKAGKAASAANIIVTLVTLVADLTIAFGLLKDSSDKAGDSIGKLNDKLQAETELYARQQQALPLIDKMADAYQTLSSQMEQYNSGSEEYKKRLQERNEVEQILINTIGKQEEETLKAQGFSESAIASVKQKEEERATQELSDIAQVKKEIASKANQMINDAEQESKALDEESDHWAILMAHIVSLGHPLDALMYGVHKLASAFDSAMVSIFDSINELDIKLRDSFIGKFLDFMGIHIQGSLGLETRSYFLQSQAEHDAAAENVKNTVISEIKTKAVTTASQLLKSSGLNFDGSGGGSNNPLDQVHLGGAETDDSPGKGKKGHKAKVVDQDNNEIVIPDSDNFGYTANKDDVDALDADIKTKLRVLDDLYYKHTAAAYGQGEHLNVSSAYRAGDSGNHGIGHAFDVSGGRLNNDADLQSWLANEGSYIGLFSIDEYDGQPGSVVPHNGGNIHFSNTTPGQFGVTRNSEGLWSTGNAAPSIYDIVGTGKKTAEYTDNSVQRKLYDTLRQHIVENDKQAWAAMASIGGESNFDPTSVEDKYNPESGIGIMQWSNSQRHALETFAAQRGTSWKDLQTQLEFMVNQYQNDSYEHSQWSKFLNGVTDSSSAYDDVKLFTDKVERAGIDNMDNRMGYYNDASSYYVNGMSLRDSNPSKNSKSKKETPEERAESEAKRLKEFYDNVTKSVDTLAALIDSKYKTALENVTEDQKFFGKNIENTQNQLDIYSAKLADNVKISKRYSDVLKTVGVDIKDGDIKRYLGVDKNDFLNMDVEKEQELMAGVKNQSVLYKPLVTTLNEVVTLKKKIQDIDAKYHSEQMQWIESYQARQTKMYDDAIKSEKDVTEEWEIKHSNDQYGDAYKNFYEQQHLEEIARLEKQKLDWMNEYVYMNGERTYDAEGNAIKGQSNPEEIRKQQLEWEKADQAAKKYAATLKNDVTKQFSDMAKNVLIQGGSLRDQLKKLWKDLAEDALTMIISGGKQNTGSLLGNMMRRISGDHQDDVLSLQKSRFAYATPAYQDWQSWHNPVAAVKRNGQYTPSNSSWYGLTSMAQTVTGVNLDAASMGNDKPPTFSTVNATPSWTNPMPVIVTNQDTISDSVKNGLSDVGKGVHGSLPSSGGSVKYTSLASLGAALIGQNDSDSLNLNTKYGWEDYASGAASAASSWGNMAVGNKVGLFAQLFGMLRHHASGGEVDQEEIATLGEGGKKEYVIPTEQNKGRGVSLWQKAGKDLGVLKDGSPVTPNFKNKELATNGVMSVQVKQQAIYMNEIRQQNKTLLNILTFMANDKSNSGNNGGTVMQPVVVKQTMDINEFSEMYKKGQQYGYIK